MVSKQQNTADSFASFTQKNKNLRINYQKKPMKISLTEKNEV